MRRLTKSQMKLLAPFLLVLGALVIFPVATTTNTVGATKAGDQSQTETANDIKPASCSAITLTALVTGTGTFGGTNAAELLLGSNAVDTMTGQGGNDCLVGGNGNDALNGGTGTDVCIGGPGTDTFNANCETQIP